MHRQHPYAISSDTIFFKIRYKCIVTHFIYTFKFNRLILLFFLLNLILIIRQEMKMNSSQNWINWFVSSKYKLLITVLFSPLLYMYFITLYPHWFSLRHSFRLVNEIKALISLNRPSIHNVIYNSLC